MFKKFIPMALVAVMLTFSSHVASFGASGSDDSPTNTAISPRPTESSLKRDLQLQTEKKTVTGETKSTLTEYEKDKKQGKRFSTTTKILIGVGVAAAVVGVVVFAASRDKIRTF